jgi:hypothetical protein
VNRTDVRELAELYLSRLDERLQSRLIEHEAKIDAKIERRFAEQDVKLERRFSEQDANLMAIRFEFADRMAVRHRELLRWLFAFWAGTVIPLAGLMIALYRI